ncbi:hypothetical protein M9H77_23868 [Catharanthus roseus]|uniref:Uncharacterized protein n=1 Tax=Catharanthus roseus TaxID=4058 RepID=A0ACC0AW11_CATRO|nr:hypothetical protein M9H77_23868 [Catharanthus roseus]
MMNTVNTIIMVPILMKDITLFPTVVMFVMEEHGDHFTWFKSPGTYLERRYFIESNSISCPSPRVDDCDFNIANSDSCVLAVEDRKSVEKELGPTLEDISISLSLNLSSLWNLFLLEPSMKNGPSSHLSLKDLLMSSSVMFDPSCYGFGIFSSMLAPYINEGKEAYHDVQKPRRKCWRKTNLILWRFDNEFFFKPISLLLCVFFQRVKIVIRIECLLCYVGGGLYG